MDGWMTQRPKCPTLVLQLRSKFTTVSEIMQIISLDHRTISVGQPRFKITRHMINYSVEYASKSRVIEHITVH